MQLRLLKLDSISFEFINMAWQYSDFLSNSTKHFYLVYLHGFFVGFFFALDFDKGLTLSIIHLGQASVLCLPCMISTEESLFTLSQLKTFNWWLNIAMYIARYHIKIRKYKTVPSMVISQTYFFLLSLTKLFHIIASVSILCDQTACRGLEVTLAPLTSEYPRKQPSSYYDSHNHLCAKYSPQPPRTISLCAH